MPFGNAYALPAHGVSTAIDTGKVHPVDTPYHLPPGIGVYHFIQCKALLRLAQERTCHPLALYIDTRLIIQIVQIVIIEAELAVGSPYIRCFPVVDGVSVEYVIAYLGSPPVVMVHLVLTVQMNTAPTVETFLRADTNKETGAHRIFPLMQPFGKVHLEFVIPHFLRIERERFFRIRTLRHLTHPKFLHALVPGTPITLIHGCAGGDLERDTYPVDFQNILIGFQYTVYIVYGYGVLYLIIHMKHTQFSL